MDDLVVHQVYQAFAFTAWCKWSTACNENGAFSMTMSGTMMVVMAMTKAINLLEMQYAPHPPNAYAFLVTMSML